MPLRENQMKRASLPSITLKPKANWAGLHISDAFDLRISPNRRMMALRLFYEKAAKAMQEAALAAGETKEAAIQAKTLVQLSPLSTSLPKGYAAFAAIGLSAFVEFQKRSETLDLFGYNHEYFNHPNAFDKLDVDEKQYASLVRAIARAAQKLILWEALTRSKGLDSIRWLKAFFASLLIGQPMNFDRLLELGLLYGDLLPATTAPVESMPILKTISESCEPFFLKMRQTKTESLRPVGTALIRALAKALSVFLESSKGDEDENSLRREEAWASFSQSANRFETKEKKPPQSSGGSVGVTSEGLLGRLLEADNPANGVVEEGDNGMMSAEDTRLQDEFEASLNAVAAEEQSLATPAPEAVESLLSNQSFKPNALSGAGMFGRSVRVRLANNRAYGGELFETAMTPCFDEALIERIMKNAKPLAARLAHMIYPNIETTLHPKRWQTDGILDERRLALHPFSDAVFKRFESRETKDERGRPLLLIAADASASLKKPQMRLLKTLTAAWALSLARTQVDLLAAIYHSGRFLGGLKAPLVRWLYHPEKTPTSSYFDVVRSLGALPAEGVGRQADALSLGFLFNEANRLANRRAIYAIILSDCAWNRSVSATLTGKEEVAQFFGNLKQGKQASKISLTLVGLGVDWDTGLSAYFDAIMNAPVALLHDPEKLAMQISAFTAERLKEARHG